MGTLSDDLAKYADELYTKKDVVAGMKLLAELAGLATLIATAAALSTVTIPFLGPSWSRTLILKLSHEALSKYEKLSADERKDVRAAIRYARAAVGLVNPVTSIMDRVDEASFFSEMAEKAEKVEEWGDKLSNRLESFKNE